jgi:hypothetical protein
VIYLICRFRLVCRCLWHWRRPFRITRFIWYFWNFGLRHRYNGLRVWFSGGYGFNRLWSWGRHRLRLRSWCVWLNIGYFFRNYRHPRLTRVLLREWWLIIRIKRWVWLDFIKIADYTGVEVNLKDHLCDCVAYPS